jgi:hypothetical protein
MKYLLIIALLFAPVLTHAQVSINEVRDITFPVEGEVTFGDDFDDARSGGRTHDATDIKGVKMQRLVSAVDGVVTYLPETEPSWGWGAWIRDADGYEYVYIHVNNDTPGTDDGVGGIDLAFAPEIRQGAHVTKGQFIGYMGDSGNAENVGPHLHFEIHAPDDTAINPYYSLLAAQGNVVPSIPNYDRQNLLSSITSINQEKNLLYTADSPKCVSNTLIKGTTSKAVYYCGNDGKRYVFPHSSVFYTWYANFNSVKTISDSTLGSIPLGGNVTYKPGTKLLKINSDPKVYAVDAGGTLRWVSTSLIAEQLFGTNWQTLLVDVDVTNFINYIQGDSL